MVELSSSLHIDYGKELSPEEKKEVEELSNRITLEIEKYIRELFNVSISKDNSDKNKLSVPCSNLER